MLAMKYTPNIFLISLYDLGQQYGIYLFLFVTYIFTRDLRNIRKGIFWTHEISTRKNLDPQNTPEKKFWTNKTLTRKTFGPTKYPRKKILNPQRYSGTMTRYPQDPQ